MGGENVPSLDETAVLINESIRAIHTDLQPTVGIGVAAFPWEFTIELANQGQTLATIGEIVRDTGEGLLEAAGDHVAALDGGLAQAKLLVEAVEGLAVEDVVKAIVEELAPAVMTCVTAINLVAFQLEPVDRILGEIRWAVQEGFDDVCRSISRLTNVLDADLGDLKLGFECDAVEAAGLLLPALEKIAAAFSGPAPAEGDEEAEPTLWEPFFEAAAAKIDQILAYPQADNPSILGWALKQLKAALGEGGGLGDAVATALAGPARSLLGAGGTIGAGAEALATAFITSWQGLTREGEATPDTVLRRCAAAYTGAVALGIVAHGISALGSLQVMGTGGLRFSGLAALAGKLAGFGPLVNTTMGSLYRNYIGVPFNYWSNERARPYLPDVGTLQRLKYKRIFNRKPSDPVQKEPPYSFQQCMAYWGYSDAWAEIYEDDLYREPFARDLLLMAECTTATDDWWAYKVRRLGYSDDDAPVMVEAFKRRAARTQILDLYRRLWYLTEQGFLSVGEFRERAAETKLQPLAVEFGAQSAEVALELREKQELLASAREQYARDVLTDDEFRDLLDTIYADSARAKRVFQIDRLKRYRRVYLYTPTETARRAMPLFKRAFLAGRLTAPEYKAKLLEGGLDADMADLTTELDGEARDRKVIAEFRRYDLPELRDRLLHGFIDVSGYRAELRRRGFPDAYLEAETDLARVLFERRQRQEVRAHELPTYRKAYVLGLVSKGQLDAAFEDAGIGPAAIEAEHVLLDWQRDEAERKRDEARVREEERAREKLRREAERERKEMEREDRERQREAEAARKARERAAAEAARIIAQEAKTAREALRPDWPADVAKLGREVERVFKANDQWLPDHVWDLGYWIEAEIARAGGPDGERLDALLGQMDMALARLAGVTPEAVPTTKTATPT